MTLNVRSGQGWDTDGFRHGSLVAPVEGVPCANACGDKIALGEVVWLRKEAPELAYCSKACTEAARAASR